MSVTSEDSITDLDMDFHEYFVISIFLKKGHFGDIYRCYDRENGKEYAVKVLTNEKSETEEIRPLKFSREAAIWRRLRHRNIVEIHRVFKTVSEQYLVMELVADGNLFDQIVDFTTYTERDACHFMKQLFEALVYLREKRVIHRDIKAENLLIKKGSYGEVLKISDFGLAVRLDKGKSTTQIEPHGVPLHLAPETILEKPVSFSVDLWSSGVILYTLMGGEPPFYSERPDHLYAEIITKNVRMTAPIWDNVSDNAKNLIKGLLDKNPKTRFSADQALHHDWISITSEIPRMHRKQTITKLKDFNARRKLKGAIFTVQTLYRMKNTPSTKRSSHSGATNKQTSSESRLFKISENARRKSTTVVKQVGKTTYKDLPNERKLSEVCFFFSPKNINGELRGFKV